MGGGISLQELESRLWEAANSLRGRVDPADFKAYVFPILFFKWISDTWDLEHAHALADFGKATAPEVEVDYHRFDVPDGCHWADLRAVSTNVGVALQRILDRLAEVHVAAHVPSTLKVPGQSRWSPSQSENQYPAMRRGVASAAWPCCARSVVGS